MVSPDRQTIVQSSLFPSLSKRGGRLAAVRQTTYPQTPEQLKQGMGIQVVENNLPTPLPFEYQQQVKELDKRKKGQPGYHNTRKMRLTPHDSQPGEQRDPNIIAVDATYLMYATTLALNKPGIPEEIRREVIHGGIAMIWITSDGKLIIEERSQNSQINPGVAGPIGGGLDGKISRTTGLLKNATPKEILGHGITESHEELGISRKKLRTMKPEDIRVVAFAQDLIKKHHDIVVMAKSDQTAEEMAQQYLKHKYGGGDHLADPMPKKLFMIDATPDAIRTLLTKSDCTIAPILQGALLAVGRQLVIDAGYKENNTIKEAVRQGDAWMKAAKEELRRNNLRLNGMVRRHNRISKQEEQAAAILAMENGKEKDKAWKQFWNKKISHRGIPEFTPEKKLEEQGRPDLEQAIKDAGLRGFVTNGVLATLAEAQETALQELLP